MTHILNHPCRSELFGEPDDRIVRERPILFTGEMVCKILDGSKTQTRRVIQARHIHGDMVEVDSPYGIKGDLLWCRETWASLDAKPDQPVIYRATADPCYVPSRWRPSIFMPRWASRITLELTGIRVERVQEITEEDAIAEGVSESHSVGRDGIGVCHTAKYHYAQLWDKINGKRAPWHVNPWVWVLTFRRIKP